MDGGFLNDEFLLSGETARGLFHNIAERAPIVDLHNHLSPADIAGDRVYETLADLWLGGDHYKWRAMRLAGFEEHLITGDAEPWDRFSAWAATLPRLVRNPLYVWSHLELRRVFGIDLQLNPATAREIWEEANRQLPHWSTQALLAHFDVRVVATTDDPGDDLAAHRHLAEQPGGPRVAMIPTFRPDGAHRLLLDPTAWNGWVDRLEAATETTIADLDSLLDALTRSYRRFAELGGRASDHGLAYLPDVPRDPSAADAVVRRARLGGSAMAEERQSVMLEVVALTAELACADDSVLQLHLGAIRDASPRLLAQVGRDVGGDVMGDDRQAPGLARFLGELERRGTLPRTVLYNLNPADNALFTAMAGAYSQPGVASLVQWGPPWWFNDHEQGMRRQLDDLSEIGQLAGFVGMLTDSRSILSMTRHELFRRVLCDAVGRDVDEGRIPADIAWCETLVRDICVDNAVRYFSLRDLLGKLMAPTLVVVMGVAGSGKSTVAAELASRRGAPFIDADALHSAANVEKMASGSPLTDEDRWPWLAALRQAMRGEEQAVVACSALKRVYRDALRAAGDVGFVNLVVDRDEVVRRLRARTGHFMQEAMVDSQFATLDAPGHDELDVVSLDASGETAAIVDRIEAALVTLPAGTSTAPLRSVGGVAHSISNDELSAIVDELAAIEVLATGAQRVLLVPPDHTRLHSRAGEITGLLFERLSAAGCEVAVLPALGTHAAMTPHEASLLFGDRIPFARILHHRWREGLVRLGEIGTDEIAALSAGRMADPIPVEVDDLLLAGWDLVVSVGQVVPHEVIGMANFTKNLVIGLGGAPTIHRSHFLGAVCDMESIMGRTHSPVRDVVDAAFDRFLAHRLPVLWVLTVTEDTTDGVVHRGVFVGRGGSNDSGGAAYEAAAALAALCDIEVIPRPLERVTCWLEPKEFTTTWVANKAVYRTRMALADGGELLVLAPGVSRFGEDPTIDALIRRHGYRGTPATLAALERDPELADNLGAAAHLIHGSSEDRFRIVYCTDPASGGLTRDEIEGVGYAWRSLPAELDRLGITGATLTGPRRDCDGEPFTHIANPGLGLWATSARFR